MHAQQIHQFLKQFFEENHCEIIDEQNHLLTAQLTIDMDKRIMNRPFYWQYLESINGDPEPAQLTLITDNSKLINTVQGEVVHFGAPRLSQIFQVAKELGAYIQVYEQVKKTESEKTILTPWLGVNYKIVYATDRTMEMLYSLGINLMTGYIVDEFHESIKELKFDENSTNNTFNLPYIITPIRALDRLDSAMERVIQLEDHQWADEAKKRWKKEMQILDYFYESMEQKPTSYELEKKAMKEQFEPKIKMEAVSGGLFYLQ